MAPADRRIPLYTIIDKPCFFFRFSIPDFGIMGIRAPVFSWSGFIGAFFSSSCEPPLPLWLPPPAGPPLPLWLPLPARPPLPLGLRFPPGLFPPLSPPLPAGPLPLGFPLPAGPSSSAFASASAGLFLPFASASCRPLPPLPLPAGPLPPLSLPLPAGPLPPLSPLPCRASSSAFRFRFPAGPLPSAFACSRS